MAANSPVAAGSAEVLLTPKDLASAIGASESSLRRWIDSGDIRISRTAGGHRRIPLAEAVQFIRRMGAVVVRPEVLNLPVGGTVGGTSAAERDRAAEEQRLFDALREGRREVARGLVLSWYLEGRALHELFDGPVKGAMYRLGELWKHEERGILVEHRATEICLGIVAGLRAMLPPAADGAPLAMGGAPAGDPYQIPSLMAATVLAEAGMRDVNFGAGTPMDLLGDEAVHSGARVVWVSVSWAAEPKGLRAGVKALATKLGARGIDLVIGGAAAEGDRGVRAAAGRRAQVIGTMGELAAFGRGLVASAGVADRGDADR